MFLTATAVGVAVVSLLLALTVLLRNQHSSYNVSFAAFASLLGLWISANYFGSYQDTGTHLPFLFFMDFTIAPLLAFSFSVFGLEAVRFYRQKSIKISRFILLMIGGLAVIFSLGAALHLVSLPIYTPSNVLNTKEVLYHPYNLFVGALALVGLLTLIYSTIGAKKEFKQQTRLVFWGLLLAAATIIAANIVFPDIRLAQTLSYFAILIMLISLSYSIVRHRLFDIRPIIARSVTYVLLLGSFATIFTISLLTLTAIFYKDQRVPLSLKITYVVLALFLAFIFQPLKLIFDRITNSLFYRDAYEPQVFIDQLNKVIVSNIELKTLLNRAARVVIANIKIEYCFFVIRENQDEEARVFGSTNDGAVFNEAALQKLDNSLLPEITTKNHIFVVDYADDLGSEKQAFLSTNNIAAVTLITPHLKSKKISAHMILGTKKSGNPYSSQDVRILGIISNEISVALQNALQFEEISRFNVTLQQKVDEATKELRRANTRLKELDATKDEFISMASHQLRTPLTTVKGYLSMILEGDVGAVKKDQKELMQHAFDGANRMVYLIADLLNVSRLQSGKFVIDNKPTNLAQVVSSEISQLNEQAANREIKFVYHKPDGFPMLNLDETKIRQVVMNFLDNALYYTPKGGSVTVDLRATDKEISYTVADTGVGVPKDAQHHLFSKFYRADNARKMRPDGTGLGLYMAKKVIAAQGGAIIFRSTEGKGSIFGFSFPRDATEVKAMSEAAERTEQKDTATSVKAKT